MNNSLWISSTEKKKRESLKDIIETDVCIIGGGLTGITSGYYLSKENKKVVILEKNTNGSHVSGNTTGKITSQHGLFYDYLINSFSKEYAQKYLKANEEAIKNIEEIINKEKIDCDFEWQSAYVYAGDKNSVKQIKKEVEAVKSLGLEAKFTNKINLPIEKLQGFYGAIEFPDQAQFNSYKYITSLGDIIENNNGKIYENSKVTDVKKEGDIYEIRTNKGCVRAKYVILATHYPIINFPGFYFMKMYQETSYLIAIETDEPIFSGMYINNEEPTLSFRTAIYKGKRIVIIGGMSHKTGKKEILKYSYNELEKVAKKLFPDSRVLFRWNTEDCVTLDKIPYIGEFSNLMPNVYVGTGYKKWGMTSSNVAAKIITDKILGRANEYEDVFDSKRLKPLKNHEELTNMIKEVGESLIINRLKSTDKDLIDIKKEEGKIIKVDSEKVGAYRDEKGDIYIIKPYCTHLGCELKWNDLDKTWDCPCHGSRFNYEGTSLYDPAIEDLEGRKL